MTLHCLIGCSLGELTGLAIGVTLGWAIWQTMTLAIVLAFLFGFSLVIFPLMRRQKISFGHAFRTVWLGEVVSISVMEIAMNFTDYHMGGMSVSSVWTWAFWSGFGLAMVAGYLAAYPVNVWMLKKNLKHCH